jgi:hypothetical protein
LFESYCYCSQFNEEVVIAKLELIVDPLEVNLVIVNIVVAIYDNVTVATIELNTAVGHPSTQHLTNEIFMLIRWLIIVP